MGVNLPNNSDCGLTNLKKGQNDFSEFEDEVDNVPDKIKSIEFL